MEIKYDNSRFFGGNNSTMQVSRPNPPIYLPRTGIWFCGGFLVGPTTITIIRMVAFGGKTKAVKEVLLVSITTTTDAINPLLYARKSKKRRLKATRE